ncbi:MAG: UvrD-helicase domain-containing protein [Candidatus Omnitrophica bacterium]|nr:UvrD-helicase domain-containing protein [Candidatus Omnitrophota bacterium]
MKKMDFNAVIIEASAGTGKTSRITGEFVSLIDRQEPSRSMRKILAMTFSEKAAIEMKVRILEKIYAEIFPALTGDKRVDAENEMLKLRISTIHSFCRLILKRFAFYLGIDPFFSVIDERQSDLLFYRAFGSFLNAGGSGEMLGILKKIKLNGLKNLIFAVRKCHPYATAGLPDGEFSKAVAGIAGRISAIHGRMKKDLSMLDFNDLEMLTCGMLSEHPEALLILDDFDEKNDYIFVDEFQDTNILQWEIVRKLSEEWLSGYGAKAEKGGSYGMFLVGDRKQSIYKFRGAEGKVFDDAKIALGDYCREEKLLKNYRSAPGIINFVNEVFKDIPPWSGQQLSPGAEKETESRIEINLPEDSAGLNAKEEEYNWALGKIFELVEKKAPVWDKKQKIFRPVNFRDIAILMRKRAGSSFLLLEKKLKESGLPFVILGGMGFYTEPETVFLSSLVFALADTSDGMALWNLRNSVHGIKPADVYGWRKLLADEELTVVTERILKEMNFWEGLGSQQKANAEKFLMIIQGWEELPLYQVSRNLRAVSGSSEESKADIFSEHQNAVRVLTVHNAKGLEFPAVFLINLEDGKVMMKDEIFYRKSGDGAPYKFILRAEAGDEHKNSFREMLKEEEQRVLYVALTRAARYLFISGVKNRRGSAKSVWMDMVSRLEPQFPPSPEYAHTGFLPGKEAKEKISFEGAESSVLTSYTQEKERDYYGSHEKTVAGEIAHKLLFDISEGRIKPERRAFSERMFFYLKKPRLHDISGAEKSIMEVYESIERNEEIKKVVTERSKGKTFSELPFIVEQEKGRVYSGFIDRIILTDDGTCRIYDYKLDGSDAGRYKRQMEIYEKAARNIFKECGKIKKFIVFLKKGAINEIVD